MNCKICSHDDLTLIFDRQFSRDYYYCPRCQFLFMDEKQYVSTEREREEYLTHNNTLKNEGYVEMFRRFAAGVVEPYFSSPGTNQKIGAGKRALDFGSGPGDCVLAHVLDQLGFDMDVYDVFFASHRVFEGESYHLITCTEVLEHLANPVEELKMLKGHLKNEGILALMTLFHPVDGSGEGTDLFRKWWYRRDVTHIGFYRPGTFRYLAQILDLELLSIDSRNTVVFRKRGQ